MVQLDKINCLFLIQCNMGLRIETSIINLMDFVCHMLLLKVSMQIESGPARYLNF